MKSWTACNEDGDQESLIIMSDEDGSRKYINFAEISVADVDSLMDILKMIRREKAELELTRQHT